MIDQDGLAKRGTIFLDVTELVALDLRTGIQRVVREVLRHGMAGASDRPVVPVMAVGKRFHQLSEKGWERIFAAGTGLAEKRITHERGVRPLVRLGKRLAKTSAPLYNALQRIYIRRLVRKHVTDLYRPEPTMMGEGAQLILLDSFWGGSSTLLAAKRARQAGTELVLVVYDLIPVSHPQVCDYRLVRKFRPLMAQAAAMSDQVLAISQDCADTFRAEFPATRPTAFPLGHDLQEDVAPTPEGWPRALWFGEGYVFVIVGSVEPRKGHETVLDAFERRWARGETDKLLIIGKVGWDVDELMARLDHHREAGRRLFHVHNATDGMLKEALQRAHGGIIASVVEGFGLPLVEGLSAGLPMIASDIAVFREIADDAALYFAPGDAASLSDAIASLLADLPERQAAAAAFKWPDWHEAASIFYTQIEAGAA